MPTARILGTFACPKCLAFVLKVFVENAWLLCDNCGRVYESPTVELVYVGDRLPKAHTPESQTVTVSIPRQYSIEHVEATAPGDRTP